MYWTQGEVTQTSWVELQMHVDAELHGDLVMWVAQGSVAHWLVLEVQRQDWIVPQLASVVKEVQAVAWQDPIHEQMGEKSAHLVWEGSWVQLV